jgi:hypothetical protein
MGFNKWPKIIRKNYYPHYSSPRGSRSIGKSDWHTGSWIITSFRLLPLYQGKVWMRILSLNIAQARRELRLAKAKDKEVN